MNEPQIGDRVKVWKLAFGKEYSADGTVIDIQRTGKFHPVLIKVRGSLNWFKVINNPENNYEVCDD